VLRREVSRIDTEPLHAWTKVTNITRGDEEVVALVIGLERQFKGDGGGAAAGHCRSDDGIVSFIEAVGHVVEVHSGRRLDADRLFVG